MRNRKYLLLCALTPVLAACSSAPEVKTTPTGPRLYVMDCGTIEVADASVFAPGVNVGKRKVLTDSCYLVVHPRGTLVWDTGVPDALADKPEGLTRGVFTFKRDKTLVSQLAQVGYPPEKIDYVAFSHMHFDHVGNAHSFTRATIIMQKDEYDAAFGAAPEKYGFDPSAYSSIRSAPVKTLEGDHDLFDDGSVVIKRATGHTPGHQALYLKLAHAGNILLSGDLVHFTENWKDKRVPAFNFDQAQSHKTMDAVAQFLKENNASLWIQHDREQNAKIKHAPAYYE